MRVFDRRAMFRGWNADREHQSMAGLASWAAFSARWRARQGLPLLHPLDVQYLTPQDFCNSLGCPLPPEVQRRRFREYVQTAVRSAGCRRGSLVSGELASVRASGFVRRRGRLPPDFQYGRADIGPYEPEALRPVRPYGVPVTSDTFPSYWLDEALVGDEDDNGDESWIEAWGMPHMASQ